MSRTLLHQFWPCFLKSVSCASTLWKCNNKSLENPLKLCVTTLEEWFQTGGQDPIRGHKSQRWGEIINNSKVSFQTLLYYLLLSCESLETVLILSGISGWIKVNWTEIGPFCLLMTLKNIQINQFDTEKGWWGLIAYTKWIVLSSTCRKYLNKYMLKKKLDFLIKND